MIKVNSSVIIFRRDCMNIQILSIFLESEIRTVSQKSIQGISDLTSLCYSRTLVTSNDFLEYVTVSVQIGNLALT